MSVIYAKRDKVLWYNSLQKYIFNAEYHKKNTQKCKKQRERSKFTQKYDRLYLDKKYFCHINQEIQEIMNTNNKIRSILIIKFLMLSLCTFAQIKGIVRDKDSNLPMEFVNVTYL